MFPTFGAPHGAGSEPRVLHDLAVRVVDLGRPVVARLGDVGGELLLDREQLAPDASRQRVAAFGGLLDARLAAFEQLAVGDGEPLLVDALVVGRRSRARVCPFDAHARLGVAHLRRMVRPGPLAAALVSSVLVFRLTTVGIGSPADAEV